MSSTYNLYTTETHKASSSVIQGIISSFYCDTLDKFLNKCSWRMNLGKNTYFVQIWDFIQSFLIFLTLEVFLHCIQCNAGKLSTNVSSTFLALVSVNTGNISYNCMNMKLEIFNCNSQFFIDICSSLE